MWGSLRVGIRDRADGSAAVARNRRLTALTGAIVLVLLVAVVATTVDISGQLAQHYVVGFFLIPPVALKLGSTGIRFFRYYAGDPSYRTAGAPPLFFRFAVAPLLVASTVVTLATGVELWLFGLRFGDGWMQAHAMGAVAMVVAASAHLVAHMRSSVSVMRPDPRAGARAAMSDRSLVLASLLLGAMLAVASLFYASPFPPSAAGG